MSRAVHLLGDVHLALDEQPGRLLPCRDRAILARMRVIAMRALREFWARHPDAEPTLAAWYHDAARATWTSLVDVRQRYATASIVGDNRVVFNIRGNRYRLVVAVNYAYGIVYIRFIGTHSAYDEIDVSTI